MSLPVWRCQYAKGYYLIPAATATGAVRRILAKKYADVAPFWVAPHLPARWPTAETSDACRLRHEQAAVLWPRERADTRLGASRTTERRSDDRMAA